MNSPLQLDAYAIETLLFVTNRDYKEQETPRGKLEVRPRIVPSKGGKKYQVVLQVSYLKDPEYPAQLPYNIRIRGRAFYTLDPDDTSAGDPRALLLHNGPAILYGLLRAHVAQATSLGLHGPMILPTANLLQALKDWIEQARVEPATKKKTLKASAGAVKE
ncbi:MAG: hypothetical protein A2133_05385 [Actinobacteria bacterium RBG_16_64_13]|nr:MAG: hypothetical protein A2133_05385 [Actinobacteria bacterium RBG_16_64_13]